MEEKRKRNMLLFKKMYVALNGSEENNFDYEGRSVSVKGELLK
jgi:hypothetical protein